MSSPVPVEPPAEVRGWAQRLYAEFVALAQAGFREHQALAIVAALAVRDELDRVDLLPCPHDGGTVEIGWALSSRVEARCADCGVGLPDACDDASAAVSWPREGMAVGDALSAPFSDRPDYRPEWRL